MALSPRRRQLLAELAQRNPLFPYFYSALIGGSSARSTPICAPGRFAPARGRLLIVGLVRGPDFRHIPPAVTSVAAVEPDPVMRRKAAKLAEKLGVRLDLRYGVGERLPFEEGSFDTVLCALVLCSVRDVDATLREIRRVIRPDGQLLVLEHVRAPEGSLAGRLQDRVAPLWSVAASGCQLKACREGCFTRRHMVRSCQSAESSLPVYRVVPIRVLFSRLVIGFRDTPNILDDMVDNALLVRRLVSSYVSHALSQAVDDGASDIVECPVGELQGKHPLDPCGCRAVDDDPAHRRDVFDGLIAAPSLGLRVGDTTGQSGPGQGPFAHERFILRIEHAPTLCEGEQFVVAAGEADIGESCRAESLPGCEVRGADHHRYDKATDSSDLVILDAETLDDVARVHLPTRVPNGFHGNWIPTA